MDDRVKSWNVNRLGGGSDGHSTCKTIFRGVFSVFALGEELSAGTVLDAILRLARVIRVRQSRTHDNPEVRFRLDLTSICNGGLFPCSGWGHHKQSAAWKVT